MKIKDIYPMVVSLYKIIKIKILYRNNVKIAINQKFGKKLGLKCNSKGTIFIGKRLFTRNNINILADGGKIVLGNYIFLNHNVSITSKCSITIGDFTKIGNNVVILDHDHNYIETGFICENVEIGKNVWIGANSVILKGVCIGDSAVIAAGSVVNRNVESNSVVAGVPAKFIKKM